MRVLSQQADLKQASDNRTGIRHVSVQFNTGEQAPTAHLANDRMVDRGEPAQQMGADGRGML
jgi:hypothetical protein